MATTNPWYSITTVTKDNPWAKQAADNHAALAPGLRGATPAPSKPATYSYTTPTFSKEVQAFLDKNKSDIRVMFDDPVAKYLDAVQGSQLYGFNGQAGLAQAERLVTGGIDPKKVQQYADQMARYYNIVGVSDPKKRGSAYATDGALYDSLLAQGKTYGVDWDVKTKGNDAFRVIDRLSELGVTSLSDLKWKGDKLYNTKTGKQIDLDKGNRLTYAAGGGGDGFVNYRVSADKNGNVVFYPQWEESSDKGKIGTIASIAANFIPGVGPLASAAIQAGIAAAAGGGLKGALTAGVGSLAGNLIAPGISNAVGVNPSGVAGGAIKGAVKGAISGGVNAGGKGALAGALIGAAGGAAGSAAGSAAGGLTDGSKLATALAGGLAATGAKAAAGQVVNQVVGGSSQPSRSSGGSTTTSGGAQVSQKAPGSATGGNSMANALTNWLTGLASGAGSINPAQLAFQNYLMQGAERDRDDAAKKAKEYADYLKTQVGRVTTLGDKLNTNVTSELANGDKDSDAVLKKLLGGDTGASAITDLKKLAATREARNTSDYNKLAGTIDDAGNRMDALYNGLGTAKMYGEGDVNALAQDIYNKKSGAVDRALKIASGQGFADALGRGLSDSSQASDTRDNVVRRFADTYAGLEADSRTQATNQVGQLATLQNGQRAARISELTNALSPELQARIQTYRPDNSALDAAKAEATFDQGNLTREAALYSTLSGAQNNRLSTLLSALTGTNKTAVDAATDLSEAATKAYASSLGSLGAARQGVFSAIAPAVNGMLQGGGTTPGGTTGANPLSTAASWLTGLFRNSGGNGADLPDGLDIDGDGQLTQTDISGWGTTGGSDASDWGFGGDWGQWWGTGGDTDWGNWGDSWGLGGDVAWD